MSKFDVSKKVREGFSGFLSIANRVNPILMFSKDEERKEALKMFIDSDFASREPMKTDSFLKDFMKGIDYDTDIAKVVAWQMLSLSNFESSNMCIDVKDCDKTKLVDGIDVLSNSLNIFDIKGHIFLKDSYKYIISESYVVNEEGKYDRIFDFYCSSIDQDKPLFEVEVGENGEFITTGKVVIFFELSKKIVDNLCPLSVSVIEKIIPICSMSESKDNVSRSVVFIRKECLEILNEEYSTFRPVTFNYEKIKGLDIKDVFTNGGIECTNNDILEMI